MIICNQCSFENPDINKFCQNCGAELTVNSDPAAAFDIEEISSISTVNLDIDNVDQPPPADPITSDETTTENPEPESIPDAEIKEENPDQDPDAIAITTEITTEAITEILIPPQEDDTAPELATPVLVKLRYAGLSDVGRERDHNEDGFRCFSQFMTTESHTQSEFQTHRGLFILCDGMGGHAGGEVASAMTLESITESFKPFWTSGLPSQAKIKEIIAIANQAIYDRNETESRRQAGRMGTTLVMVVIDGLEVAIAHVGDSRIYKITEDGLTQLTQDHEVAVKLIAQGMDEAIAYGRHDAHQLTQAIGPNSSKLLEPDVTFFSLESPTLFLLCSDGLSDNQVVESHYQHLVPLLAPDSDLKTAVKDIVNLGNDLNGYDNISAVLVHCQIDLLNATLD